MRLPILCFVFIALWHVSAAQESFINSSTQNSSNCPLMEVNINSNDNDIIEIFYCNHGNVRATGVYVEIEITNDLLITKSTFAEVPPIINKKYTFNVEDVNSLDCGVFYIEVPDADKRGHCINAQVFPNNPCQAMIDQYIINHGGSDTGNNNGIVTTATLTSAVRMQHSISGNPLGQGGPNSVFEDHVFLDNIPTWDSLLVVLTNSGVLPTVGNGNVSSADTTSGLTDITTLTFAELCFDSDGNRIILTNILSQTLDAVLGDKTISGGNGNHISVYSDDAAKGDGKIIGGGTGKSQKALDRVQKEEYKYKNEEVTVYLYPNPFSTTTTITVDGAVYKQTTLEILDISGKKIQSLQFNEQERITLHRGNLIQGIYFYRLIGDNVAVHTGKFVVQ